LVSLNHLPHGCVAYEKVTIVLFTEYRGIGFRMAYRR
jgi:hypothetical protein